MAKYLVKVNYTAEGVKGLLKEGGSSRRAVVDKLMKSVGGTLESFYYALGDTDLFVICDLPDNVSVAAVALTVAATGTAQLSTTSLMTAEEVDAAAKKSPAFRPAGK